MSPCASLVSLLSTYDQATEDTGVRRPISLLIFKRECVQKRYRYSDNCITQHPTTRWNNKKCEK